MEKWAKIVDCPAYSVSSEGCVRRDEPSRGYPAGGHILKPGVGAKGHRYVNLWRNNSAVTRYVHRLVLEAFVGPAPKDKPCAGHRNGDPADNRLLNLRWVSFKENSQDSIVHGTSRRPGGFRHAFAKLTPDMISEARKMRDAGQSMRAIGRAFGLSHGTISDALSGRSYREVQHEAPDPALDRRGSSS